ncbi:MAG: PrsW family intramembrane metalloprotease [Spirochaetaceae bacterium]|nr:MAG: PrsW family intramembrane metalloprotease [Spirochaetaceae bacterium]
MSAAAVFLAVFPSFTIVVILALRSRSIDRTTSTLFVAAAIGGAVAVVPVAVLLLAIARVPVSYDDTVARFLSAYIRSALLEETFKLIAVVTVLHLSVAQFHRVRVEFVAIAVAAGFAGAETLLYLSASIETLALRAVTAFPVHIVASAIVGLSLARRGIGVRVAIGLLVAVVFHGTYNLSVAADWTGISIAIAAVACLLTIGSVFFLSPSQPDFSNTENRGRASVRMPSRRNITRSRRKS